MQCPPEPAVSEKADGEGDPCRSSGLAEGRAEAFGPSRRGTMRRKDSGEGILRYNLGCRKAEMEIPGDKLKPRRFGGTSVR